MFSKIFLKDLAERTIATFAETLLAAITVTSSGAGGLNDVVWTLSFSVAALAALAAALKGIVAQYRGSPHSASLVEEVGNVQRL